MAMIERDGNGDLRVSRGIPLAVALAMAAQLGGGIWVFAQLDARVGVLETADTATLMRVAQVERLAADLVTTVAVIQRDLETIGRDVSRTAAVQEDVRETLGDLRRELRP